MSRALITGIAGQDGGYVAEQLVAAGWSVHGIVRPGEVIPDHLTSLGDALVLHELDLVAREEVGRLWRSTQPDEVYNLAGLSSVARSWEDPLLTAEVNGLAVLALLELVREQSDAGQPCRLLQASSGEIFAGSGCSPQDELTPVRPLSPYGAAKAFAHQCVQVYRERGLHAVNVVLYNHESPRRPETFVTRKITRAVVEIAQGRQHRLVLGSLSSRRDWGWAPEYADGMVRALRHREASDWILATGISHSVEEFVAAAFSAVGIADWRSYVVTDDRFYRPSDSSEMVGDPSRAEKVLGWRASTSFEQVVQRMVEHDLAVART